MIVELKYPCTTDLNHFPSSAIDRCLRLRSSSFSALNLAESRLWMVLRRTRNLPVFHVCPQKWVKPSVVRHTDGRLLRAARPRFTFSRISEALAVQINGLGSLLCCSTETIIVVTSSLTL